MPTYQTHNVARQPSMVGRVEHRSRDQITNDRAALQSFESHLDGYMKANALRYRHLAISERINPSDYRVKSGPRTKPTPVHVLEQAMRRWNHFASWQPSIQME